MHYLCRIHIKEDHEGVEPNENFSQEHFANSDDFTFTYCMICDKKYKEKHSLKAHLVNFHLGLHKVADDKDPMKVYEASLDPLGGSDPLSAEIEAADPFGECQDSEEKSNLDTSSGSLKLQEVNIDSIKANADLNNGESNGTSSNQEESEANGASESKESSPEIMPVLTEKEKELLNKMFYHLKKYGCAFCTERYLWNLFKFI